MVKILSLKLNKEFKRVYFKGRFKAHPVIVTYKLKNYQNKMRYGITVSKKMGNAVFRNRAKRIIKQAYFELVRDEDISFNGYDFVFVARSEIKNKKTNDIKIIMKKQISFLSNL